MGLVDIALKSMYVEGYLNTFVFGPALMLFPKILTQIFLPNEQISNIAAHHQRFFGATVFAFVGVLLVRSLNEGGKSLKLLTESLAIADLLYVGSFTVMTYESQSFNAASIGNIVVGGYIFLCRLLLLHQYDFKKTKSS